MQADALLGYRPFCEGYSFEAKMDADALPKLDTEAERLATSLLNEGWASFDDFQKLAASVPGDTVPQAGVAGRQNLLLQERTTAKATQVS